MINMSPPPNGLLSGMILPAIAGVCAVIVGLFCPEMASVFNTPITVPLLNGFGISILLMVVHKIESYFTYEYNVCPVYLTNGQKSWAQNPRQAIFVAFVGTFLLMMGAVFLVMKGGVWPRLLLSIWLAQGLHEWHHSAKSLAQRSYYSGTVSALLFVLHIDFCVAPLWFDTLLLSAEIKTLALQMYYGIQPVVFIGFYLEHRKWKSAVTLS